ncbi:MAG: hypothetical protein Q8R96_11745 [Bacteroidota bacterium]|nr:hypothetical protein [Bacteroidota bacterium]
MKKVKKSRKTGKANAGAAKLKKIIARAKVIYKAHPSRKWTSCIKEAAKK